MVGSNQSGFESIEVPTHCQPCVPAQHTCEGSAMSQLSNKVAIITGASSGIGRASAFVGAKYQIPAMQARGGGSLIFTSTFVGHTLGLPGMAAYAASKAGLIGLTQVLAAEFGAQGVRVNALLPGGTDTPMGRAFTNTPESLAFVQNMHALKRLAQPEEIARSALYLASDASSFTTGIALLADGGVSICRT
ncbi:SDR family oxidoreductase [Aeromonas media]|uniref:SDR family oxidoreductase n=1 Tax=Aeromonas media TaxID=651 RepID=UPI00384E3F20